VPIECGFAALVIFAAGFFDGRAPVRVSVPLMASGEIELAELVVRLAEATRLEVTRPHGDVTLPVMGTAGKLSRKMLMSSLGSGVEIAVEGESLLLTVDPNVLTPSRREEWRRRVQDLARDSESEAFRRTQYGMHALKSYRPNDPRRSTVCLVHGVNSSSGGFVHMIPPLEAAGYGVVVFDYRYNRSLAVSCRDFARDWSAFRRKAGESRAWALVSHSMGGLLARDYVEGPFYHNDASTLIMIAPVNQGSHLAKTQTILQLLDSSKAVHGRKTSDALAHLGDGLGEAAGDMATGSAFLRGLNGRPRRAGLAYHIMAGDVGVLSRPMRVQIENRVEAAGRQGGLLGGITRLAAGGDFSDRLDELSDGTGDGCVSVARTRLEGVSDHIVVHANHAELIRAPLLFVDPGPVACMPDLLRWLGSAGAGNSVNAVPGQPPAAQLPATDGASSGRVSPR